MDAIQKEWLWKMFLSAVRGLMSILGGALVTYGIITKEQSDTFVTTENATIAAGIILALAPRFWAWARINFEVYFPRKAREASIDTPMAEIKKETFKSDDTPNFMTSA